MTNKNTSTTEPLDAKEILSLVDLAAGQFASAAAYFLETAAIFEAIAVAAPRGSLMSRLANLGAGLCEQHDSEFTEQQVAYEAHLERFDSKLQESTGVCNG